MVLWLDTLKVGKGCAKKMDDDEWEEMDAKATNALCLNLSNKVIGSD